MKTFKSFFTLFFVSIFFLSINSCCNSKDNQEELGPYNEVRTAQGFKELITNQGPEVQILDFRSEAEFAAGHIPGAKNFTATYQNTASDDASFCKDILNNFNKNKPLLIYGGNNIQLKHVVPGRISRIGFNKVNTYILLGGFNAWKEKFPEAVEK